MQGRQKTFTSISQVVLMCITLLACASPDYPPAVTLKKVSQVTLPPGLAETSGLYCREDSLLTINDSGNLPLIHTIDYQGNIQSATRVAAPNNDWEAITLTGDTLVVADIGNNRGNRTDLSLITINSKSGETRRRLPLAYKANPVSANQAYAHDFDAEAITAVQNTVYLFSKSWATQIANVYRFTLDDDLTALRPQKTIQGLPGVITGADWDSGRHQFVLIGYLSDPFGNFDAFISRLDRNLRVLDTWPLTDFKQVEGICVSANGDYWISQEAGSGSQAVLAQFRLQNER
ncbi:hypothetical protein GCM10007391_08820 [Alteromonas halophila]|uniref:Phytase-like domain-containing protein n=2 Tax=Alteromonas halophila TaxID=516698 RepID=A0A918JH58_9ALTE|nr:hypothetical protein GCM10007391_08820 [Alteromonas halophila]